MLHPNPPARPNPILHRKGLPKRGLQVMGEDAAGDIIAPARGIGHHNADRAVGPLRLRHRRSGQHGGDKTAALHGPAPHFPVIITPDRAPGEPSASPPCPGMARGGTARGVTTRGGTANHGSAELSGTGNGSGRQSGRSAPQSQRCADGLPVRLPPVSYRQAQSRPAMQATCPSRCALQAGCAEASPGRRRNANHHIAPSCPGARYPNMKKAPASLPRPHQTIPAGVAYFMVTAWRPRCPSRTSRATFSPCCTSCLPARCSTEECRKTSWPPSSGVTKPKPRT